MRCLLRVSFIILFLIVVLASAEFAQAQLERLRNDRPVEQAAPAETPMVEIPAGEFAMGLDGVQALEDERPMHLLWLDRASAPGQAWTGFRFISIPRDQAEQLRHWIDAPGGQYE